MFYDLLGREQRGAHESNRRGESFIKLTPSDGFCASAVPQNVNLFAHESESIVKALKPLVRPKWQIIPIITSVSERDEVPRQVPAVYRGNVLRIERTQVSCIVPIIEMTAESGEGTHCGKGRL